MNFVFFMVVRLRAKNELLLLALSGIGIFLFNDLNPADYFLKKAKYNQQQRLQFTVPDV